MIDVKYIEEAIELAKSAGVYHSVTIDEVCKYAKMFKRMDTGEFDRAYDQLKDTMAQANYS